MLTDQQNQSDLSRPPKKDDVGPIHTNINFDHDAAGPIEFHSIVVCREIPPNSIPNSISLSPNSGGGWATPISMQSSWIMSSLDDRQKTQFNLSVSLSLSLSLSSTSVIQLQSLSAIRWFLQSNSNRMQTSRTKVRHSIRANLIYAQCNPYYDDEPSWLEYHPDENDTSS